MFHVGDVIRKLRIERQLTIRKLAKLAAVHTNTLVKIERGEGNPTMATLDAIGQALGVHNGSGINRIFISWAQAVTGPTKVRPEWRRLIKLWTILDADHESQRLLLALIGREATWVLRHVTTVAQGTSAPPDQTTPSATLLDQRTAVHEAEETSTTGSPYAAAPGERKNRADKLPEVFR